MAKLKFKEDEKGEPTKEAVGMYSKDGEYVDFDEPCKCVGQVCTYVRKESWPACLLYAYVQCTIFFRLSSG